MKKWCLLLILILLVSCEFSSKKENQLEIKSNNRFSEIDILNRDYDFGLLKVNDSFKYNFKVHNTSMNPLRLSKVISNNNRLDIYYEDKEVGQDKKIDVSVVFKPLESDKGFNNILILIEGNFSKGVEVVSISGIVE